MPGRYGTDVPSVSDMRTGIAALAALAIVAAACGDDAEPSVLTSPPSTSAATTTVPDGQAGAAAEGLSLLPAGDWTATRVGEGAKPALALDVAGDPAIAWVLEDLEGYVAFASQAEGWEFDEVAAGYFYGPIGLAFGADDRPHIVFHDHQDTTFKQDLGDLTHAIRSEGDWSVRPINDAGHDGWDSTITIGPDGVVRAAGIDPQQFDSDVGVEYYELTDSGWVVTEIGSGPIEYEWNVSLAVDPDGNPAVSYFDNNTQDLMFASRVGGEWTIETVASEGDVGRFSSLTFDTAGRPHISYFALPDTVAYAVRSGGTWTVETVGTLPRVVIAFEGARRITDIAIDGAGVPHIAFTDRDVVRLASRFGGAWQVEDVAAAGELPLGQQVSLRIDRNGVPHLATYEVTGSGPLTGVIAYLKPA